MLLQLRECGVLNSLSETAQNVLANLITIFLGITIASQMVADKLLKLETFLILGLGLLAFVFDTFGGVMLAKVMNLFTKNKINPPYITYKACRRFHNSFHR